MRIRIAWGGGSERLWYGNVVVTDGKLSQPRSLGIEADEPGSMWLDTNPTYLHPLPAGLAEKIDLAASPSTPSVAPLTFPATASPTTSPSAHLVIRQRSPRTYDAVDLVVSAEPEAKLLVELVAADEPGKPGWTTIPLAGLLGGAHDTVLDNRGNRLLVCRRPDDDLRVEIKHPSLVFAPKETLKFDLLPHLPALESGTELRIEVALTAARDSRALWSTEHTARAGQVATIHQEIVLPEREGAYDVVVTARRGAGLRWPSPVSGGLKWKNQPFAVRKVQVLVLRPEPDDVPLATEVEPGSVVDEVEPASPKRWERFARLPHLRRSNRHPKEPWGDGDAQPTQHALGSLLQLAPSSNPGKAAWRAYSLSIDEPGQVHVLEVNYPSDVVQTMGISIIEPNAAGALFPIGLDSGVDRAEDVAGDTAPPRWLTHRVVFWPRTKTPIVLVTNRHKTSPAVYGTIRVRELGGKLPRAFGLQDPAPARLLAAYLDRPLFPENHTAEEALGSLNDLGVDDWVTFHQGGTRLVAYLDHVGYGGLMIAALADGSTIYPSRLLEPTPRYDTGVFLAEGQDPIRKDVLEMLFRLFDRDRLKLIPALEFAAPLPRLEAVVRRGGPESEGIRWIGRQGRCWPEVHAPMRGMAPYYNVLDPRVQEAMLEVVRELVARYGHHPSFAGLGVQLSAHGYAQLPGPEWGVDDATIAQFEEETGAKVPGSGPRRFAERANWLANEHLQPWLQWRAARLSRFYSRVRQELSAASDSDARLYLTGANMFEGPEMRRQLQPALPQRTTMAEALLHVGIDVANHGIDRGIVLPRSEQITPRWAFSAQAVDLVVRQLEDIDSCFQASSTPGSLFFHKPQELRLASFDTQSPFKRSYTWLATQPVPSDARNRRRFVHALASLDAQVMFDGGWQLPMGQQDALADLVAAYRRLPAVRFERFVDPAGQTVSQPVTVRYAMHAGSMYVYAVNEASFPTTARIRLTCPNACRLEELSGLRRVESLQSGPLGTTWTVRLQPYDLVAVRLSEPSAKLIGVDVFWPKQVQKTLQARMTDLGDRTAVLRSPPLLKVLPNPGFEYSEDDAGRIPGWATSSLDGASVNTDGEHHRGGRRSLHLASNGPVASLVSEPFDAPATGRLTMLLWLRTTDTTAQPPLRLALVGKHQGRDLFHPFWVGKNLESREPAQQLGTSWHDVLVEFEDLPLENLSQLQLRFDLMGPGEVWMDDLQLTSLSFSQKEHVELLRLIYPADLKLQQGQLGDCLELFESYWPRFLVANVSLPDLPPEPRPRPTLSRKTKPSEQPVKTSGLLNRMKNRLPNWLRF